MVYVATRAIAQGRNAGIISALGLASADLIYIQATALGLSSFTAASPVAFSIVKYAGAAYLIYMGVQTFLSKAGELLVKARGHAKLSEVFYQGLLVNLLNPQTILFSLAFLPQFVDPAQGRVTLQLLLLGVLWMIICLSISVSIGLAGGQFGAGLRARRGVQQTTKWVTGSIYIALGVTTVG